MASIKQAFDLSGKTALITGGSRGLGLQMAEALGEQGAHIVLSSRKAEELEKAQQHLSAMAIRSDWIAADGQKAEDVERLARDAISKTGRIDILVNNAGATWGAPTTEHSLEAWDKLMSLNVRCVFYLSQQIGKLSMIPNGGGRILNIASIAGKEGNPMAAAYSSSKGAVIALTKAIGKDLAGTGVLVNSIAPAVIDTPILGQITEEHVSYMTARIPLGRVGEPEEVAALICWLASEDMTFSTGACFDISGGRAVY